MDKKANPECNYQHKQPLSAARMAAIMPVYTCCGQQSLIKDIQEML
jgi:hypothetical protein